MLGVASVLGGFSISDSMRRHSEDAWMKRGGFDKLNVQQAGAIRDGTTPTALQNANLGLRKLDEDQLLEMEDLLLQADLGVHAVDRLMLRTRSRARYRSDR